MKRTIAAVSAIAAAFIVAGAAGATPPVFGADESSYAGEQQCGAFVDHYQGTTEVREATFFDDEGNPIRHVHWITVSETDTNSVTQKTIDVSGHATFVVDLTTGATSLTGLFYLSSVSGEGAVIVDAGRLEVGDGFNLVGRHDVLGTSGEVFCTALS